MSVLDEIKTLKAEIEKLRKEADAKVEAIFKKAVLELFVEYPNLERISWTQYTPYFNDGDPCVFRSSHDSPAIYFTSTVETEVDEDDDDYDRWEEEWSIYEYYDYSKDFKTKTLKPNLTEEQLAEIKTGEAVQEFLSIFDNDDMDKLFGDGFKVIITKDKVEVEDYNHE